MDGRSPPPAFCLIHNIIMYQGEIMKYFNGYSRRQGPVMPRTAQSTSNKSKNRPDPLSGTVQDIFLGFVKCFGLIRKDQPRKLFIYKRCIIIREVQADEFLLNL